LKKDKVQEEKKANQTHYQIGKNIRQVIAKMGERCQKIYQRQKKV